LYKNDHIKFYLQLIDIKNLTGYGLCSVIIIFMLRKLYNKAVENYSNNKYIYTAETKNSSKQHYAKNCYLTAFDSLGFKLTEEIIGKETINADIYYFRKENNDKIWEKIEEDLYYTNSRSKIKYTIGTDEIKMEKI
jgi:hypothetical protein